VDISRSKLGRKTFKNEESKGKNLQETEEENKNVRQNLKYTS
jgi:hypothetical protein